MTVPPGSTRIVVAHLGARRHYLVPRSLAAGGNLERFYTDVYFGRRPWADVAAAALMGSRGLRFKGRSHPELPSSLVTDFPLLALPSRNPRGGVSDAWIIKGSAFGRAVAKRGFGDAKVALAFSSAALEIFESAREKGVATILDHATAPRDREMQAVADEEQRFLGWTARRVLEDPGLADYASRQGEERILADRILCGSTFVAAELVEAGTDPAKLRVVPLAIGASEAGTTRRRARGRELRVLFVGNEGLRKGLGYLVEAVSSLRSAKVRLRVAGDPGFSSAGMTEVMRVAEECRPVMRSEMPSWYGWADVLVLPSISDTFGLVILEAMALGLPVIASTASGGPDVIRDGIDGWIVPPRNAAAIAERLDQLASNPTLAEEMGEAARLRATQFDAAAYRRQLLEAITA